MHGNMATRDKQRGLVHVAPVPLTLSLYLESDAYCLLLMVFRVMLALADGVENFCPV